MSDDAQVYSEPEVRATVSMRSAIESAGSAFSAAALGEAVMPNELSLDVPDHNGEVHVKGAYLIGSDIFAIKVGTGFPHNSREFLPPSNGLTNVFDARTGVVRAVFLDNGYLTNLRTGAAGALALKVLGAAEIGTIAIIGAGDQARFQIEGALGVRSPSRILVSSRSRERCESVVDWAREHTDARVEIASDLESAVRAADAIVTVTASRHPIVRREWVRPGAHITAIGSDAVDKRELDPALLRSAARVVADDVAQSRRIGELKGIGDDELRRPPVSIGAVLLGREDGRMTDEDITIADLSGIGVQDAAIADVALAALERSLRLR